MAFPVVIGNWTHNPVRQDSVSAAKTISVVDTRLASEMNASQVPPDKEFRITQEQSMYYTDHTSGTMQSGSLFAIGRENVNNIYAKVRVPAAAKLPQTTGRRVYLTDVDLYTAGNSVSGVEYIHPVTWSLTGTCSDWAAIPQDVIIDSLKHFLGLIFDGQGNVIPTTIINAFKGDVDVSR